MSEKVIKEDISIVLCGAAGLGIRTVEHLLTKVLKASEYYTYIEKKATFYIRYDCFMGICFFH